MVKSDLIEVNVRKARELERLLETLGCPDEVIGKLGTDLSDLYAGAVRYQQLLDNVLKTPPHDRDRLNDLLVDLHVEMGHLRHHLEKSVELVWDVAVDLEEGQ